MGTIAEFRLLALDSLKYSNKVEWSVKAVISREPEYELTQTFLYFFIFYIHKIGIVVLSA